MAYNYWGPDTAAGYFKVVLERQILTERIVSISEIYRDSVFTEESFREVWGQNPRDIRILKGPGCLKQELAQSESQQSES